MMRARTDYRAFVAARGYAVLYRQQQVNLCPGCGGKSWHVGRLTAECGGCATAIPLIAPIPLDIPTKG